ncbi:ankyrin repeat domain-containing protein [Nocardiopsis sp. RSe5-2]|uniref:Ankyrin repeat domain-containing protein n=1 Tax=Nocardiopsis endophytica TaxID=3018445 RepID=A0ABT4TXP5_9ACTN|nr:ankyrin repeat domain-containing protein [Nocardiopsis endophytica]MDA2809459.1 ankyrin repeat domain-containing protein [Nocardiopsis endophytica]
MDQTEIVRMLADADAGRVTGPVGPNRYAVVAYDLDAEYDGEDEDFLDYDEDLECLSVWGLRPTAAEAFDLLGDKLADRLDGAVDEYIEHALGPGVEVDDFDAWFEGDADTLALLKAKPTPGRKMLVFLLQGYHAPMDHLDEKDQPYDAYLGPAAKLFHGARALYGASAAPPYHDEAMAVFELQPTDREDGPNSLDDRGMSPLHHAVARGDLAEVTALLEEGADPNLQAEYGNSPLFAAVDVNGQVSSVLETIDGDRWALIRTLLDHGAQINARNRVGRTLVDLAVATLPYPAEIIGELRTAGGRSFRYGPDALEKMLERSLPREEKAFQVRLGEIRYLLESGADRHGLLHRVFRRTGYSDGELPEHRLVALVELLLAQSVRDEVIDGTTAADLARRWVDHGLDHYRAAVDLLERHSAQAP